MDPTGSDSDDSARVAAVQYAAVAAAPRSFHRPPRVPFDGDFKAAKVWKRRFEILLRGWPEDAKLQAILESFEGPAKTWIDHIIETTEILTFDVVWSKVKAQWPDVEELPTLNLVEDMKRIQQKGGENVDVYAQRLLLYLSQEAGETEGDLSKPFFAKLFLSGLLPSTREKTRDLLLSADLARAYREYLPMARKAQFIVGHPAERSGNPIQNQRHFSGPHQPPRALAQANTTPRASTSVDDITGRFKDLKVSYCRRCDRQHEHGYCPSVTCHSCREVGHYANECPSRRNTKTEGVNAVYLVDEDDADLIAAVAKRAAVPVELPNEPKRMRPVQPGEASSSMAHREIQSQQGQATSAADNARILRARTAVQQETRESTPPQD
ncbi:hypothetical protein CXG81DRAFT_21534, partial [Caulochytrium protostelioides]